MLVVVHGVDKEKETHINQNEDDQIDVEATSHGAACTLIGTDDTTVKKLAGVQGQRRCRAEMRLWRRWPGCEAEDSAKHNTWSWRR
jgi:hypothetical protein